MTERTLSVALLAANAAFADIVGRALDERRDYSATCFDNVAGLAASMHREAMDVVVLDTDMSGHSPIDIMSHLRAAGAKPFKTIVLTRAASAFHQAMLTAGADMVLQKPILPRHLLDAIDGLEADQLVVASGQTHKVVRSLPRTQSRRMAPTVRVGNVIPLFGEGRSAR